MKDILVGIIMALFIYGLFVENDYEDPPKKKKIVVEEDTEDVKIKVNGEWIDK